MLSSRESHLCRKRRFRRAYRSSAATTSSLRPTRREHDPNGIFIAQGGAFGRNLYACPGSYEPEGLAHHPRLNRFQQAHRHAVGERLRYVLLVVRRLHLQRCRLPERTDSFDRTLATTRRPSHRYTRPTTSSSTGKYQHVGIPLSLLYCGHAHRRELESLRGRPHEGEETRSRRAKRIAAAAKIRSRACAAGAAISALSRREPLEGRVRRTGRLGNHRRRGNRRIDRASLCGRRCDAISSSATRSAAPRARQTRSSREARARARTRAHTHTCVGERERDGEGRYLPSSAQKLDVCACSRSRPRNARESSSRMSRYGPSAKRRQTPSAAHDSPRWCSTFAKCSPNSLPGKCAARTRVLYGGSVEPDNVRDLAGALAAWMASLSAMRRQTRPSFRRSLKRSDVMGVPADIPFLEEFRSRARRA